MTGGRPFARRGSALAGREGFIRKKIRPLIFLPRRKANSGGDATQRGQEKSPNFFEAFSERLRCPSVAYYCEIMKFLQRLASATVLLFALVGCSETPPESQTRYYYRSNLVDELPNFREDPSDAPEDIVDELSSRLPRDKTLTEEEEDLQSQIDVIVLEISQLDPQNETVILEKLEELETLAQQLPDD